MNSNTVHSTAIADPAVVGRFRNYDPKGGAMRRLFLAVGACLALAGISAVTATAAPAAVKAATVQSSVSVSTNHMVPIGCDDIGFLPWSNVGGDRVQPGGVHNLGELGVSVHSYGGQNALKCIGLNLAERKVVIAQIKDAKKCVLPAGKKLGPMAFHVTGLKVSSQTVLTDPAYPNGVPSFCLVATRHLSGHQTEKVKVAWDVVSGNAVFQGRHVSKPPLTGHTTTSISTLAVEKSTRLVDTAGKTVANTTGKDLARFTVFFKAPGYPLAVAKPYNLGGEHAYVFIYRGHAVQYRQWTVGTLIEPKQHGFAARKMKFVIRKAGRNVVKLVNKKVVAAPVSLFLQEQKNWQNSESGGIAGWNIDMTQTLFRGNVKVASWVWHTVPGKVYTPNVPMQAGDSLQSCEKLSDLAQHNAGQWDFRDNVMSPSGCTTYTVRQQNLAVQGGEASAPLIFLNKLIQTTTTTTTTTTTPSSGSGQQQQQQQQNGQGQQQQQQQQNGQGQQQQQQQQTVTVNVNVPPQQQTFTASTTVSASATVNCPSGSASATASATASGYGSATSTVSQSDADNKANSAAHAAATANAQVAASAKCTPAPSHFTNLSCRGFEEISGGGSFLVDCDVSDDNGAPISLNVSGDANAMVSGVNCITNGGSASCPGNGTFEFRVTGKNDGSSVLTSTISVVASANGVDSKTFSQSFSVDPSSGGFSG